MLKKSIYAVILAIVTMFGTVGFAQDNLSVFEHYTNVLKEEGKTPGEKYITRSEFIAVLMKQLNYTRDVYICSFDDVSDSDWEYVYIANAEHKKIAMGTDNAKFSPHALLSVQEAITFVSRAYTINPYFGENEKSTLINFGGNSYSENYIKYALVEGLYPKKNASKAQSATGTISCPLIHTSAGATTSFPSPPNKQANSPTATVSTTSLFSSSPINTPFQTTPISPV